MLLYVTSIFNDLGTADCAGVLFLLIVSISPRDTEDAEIKLVILRIRMSPRNVAVVDKHISV